MATVTMAKIPLIRQILSKIQTKDHGVLGFKDKTHMDKKDLTKVVIVDPAGLNFIRTEGPDRAGGASRAIYDKFNIKTFSDDVKKKIFTGEAVYQKYKKGKVIHVVGPDFSKSPDPDLTVLAESYVSVFREFVTSGQTHLRLLPISGGTYAGRVVNPEVTWKYLIIALTILNPDQLTYLENKTIEMCLYEKYDAYKDYFEKNIKPGVSDAKNDTSNTASIFESYTKEFLEKQVKEYEEYHDAYIKAQIAELEKYNQERDKLNSKGKNPVKNTKKNKDPKGPVPQTEVTSSQEKNITQEVPFFEATSNQKRNMTHTFIKENGYSITLENKKIILTPNNKTIKMTPIQIEKERSYFLSIPKNERHTITYKNKGWTIEPNNLTKITKSSEEKAVAAKPK